MKIIEYLKQTYDPLSIIVYGSYANESNNEHSDFDALVISKSHKEFHDVSFVNDIQLDAFIYPISHFENLNDYNDFVQIFDGKIIFDTNNYGLSLKKHVIETIKQLPKKSNEEINGEIEWCKKMLLRTKRNDAEGMFRWHWLLTESLEIFCDIKQHVYFGPKKSLQWMEKEWNEAYTYYVEALYHFNHTSIEKWIHYLENANIK